MINELSGAIQRPRPKLKKVNDAGFELVGRSNVGAGIFVADGS